MADAFPLGRVLVLSHLGASAASCEALWVSNHSASYGSSIGLSEPGNAISSLTFT